MTVIKATLSNKVTSELIMTISTEFMVDDRDDLEDMRHQGALLHRALNAIAEGFSAAADSA
jgi:hypothetical protein